jgi:phosphoribosyl 1,2-cyclic phosphodiesterase
MITSGNEAPGPGLSIQILASGSKGNCTLIRGDGFHCLLDAGLAPTLLRDRLRGLGLDLGSLDAVLLTHEHGDHVRGLAPLLRAGVPVYGTRPTLKAAWRMRRNGADGCFHPLRPLQETRLGPLRILPIPVPHDAASPVAYRIQAGETTLVHCTDLGHPSPLVMEHLQEATVLVLEANHDPELLASGPYPVWLKRRIAGSDGHLSNEDMAMALERYLENGGAEHLRHLVLAHLSEVNNTPEHARARAAEVLRRFALEERVALHVARQDRSLGPLIL